MLVTLKKWLSLATPAQKQALAKSARTSVQTLGHIASGRRGGSASAAISISNASAKMDRPDPTIDQASVCKACKGCFYYQNHDA